MAEKGSNIKIHATTAQSGLDLDSSVSQIQKGKLSYALNANVENFDATSISYQNEQGNILCLEFPEGYKYHGGRFIQEINKHIIFLVNPDGGSEIGYMENNDCIYHTIVNSDCLGFDVNYPILKVVHKITNCSVEIYWTDGYNPRRFMDINNPPYKLAAGSTDCDPILSKDLDCNQLNVQPNFLIPTLEVIDVVSGGNLTAGTVQFAIQYGNVAGEAYTSYYSITNPTPIANTNITTVDFNYPVGKSVVIQINNIDNTGFYEYYNLAVIKTVNGITSAELIGTYPIEGTSRTFTYNGQNQTQIRLSLNDIFEKFPYYEIAQDLTTVQDIIIWDQLTSIDRINYQQIANGVKLLWESYKIPNTEDYANELNATNLRGYLRDEVYPFEIVFLLTNGKQTDGFHIPGRVINEFDQQIVPENNPDYIGSKDTQSEYWEIYNTATILGTDPNYSTDPSYKGKYQYGEFSYWESTETYPCNDKIWGELAGLPIRHHKFPDVAISPIFQNPEIEKDENGKYTNLQIQKNPIFALGVKIDPVQVKYLIQNSNLTQSQKDQIAGFKIVRGNRDVNKSIVAKGILRNVGKYNREGTDYYFPNYPYNDLREDPFLLSTNNAYNSECTTYEIVTTDTGTYLYTSCSDGTLQQSDDYVAGETIRVCSLTEPVITPGTGTVTSLGSYDTYLLYVQRKVDLSTVSVTFQYEDYYTGTTSTIEVEEGNRTYVNVATGDDAPTVLYNPKNNKTVITKMGTTVVNSDCYPERLSAFKDNDSKLRHVFNSPETSFGQPFLGDTLKLENVIFGTGNAHFVEVKKNALYKLISKEAQEDALDSSVEIADITDPLNTSALFAAYQSYLQIYLNGITRRNYGWSYNSILSYNYYSDINNGLDIKQRKLDHSQYLYPGVQSVNELTNINNYQRESSVYLKTNLELPYPSETDSLLNGFGNSKIEDKSRFISSQINCGSPEEQFPITSVAYYGSIKNIVPNQWGQIYSYETIDTGYQVIFDENDYQTKTIIFGGDTFIGKFSFKTKLSFFIDNRVGAPDDSDIYYDEIGNVAYPEYWHSARSILSDYTINPGSDSIEMKNLISVKAHNFDCPNNTSLEEPNPSRSYYDGKMYMFAYGIPTFYCESSINVDLRQAFNNREGDFYPHVGTGIPDDWLQESFVPIVQDNTYHYNVTYSKQNKENFFSHLPDNWEEELCYTNYPFRAIYSDPQQSYSDNRINSWLLYRASSFFDFPQNYGSLTSLDGIQNKQVLVRFENKSLLYNALYTNVINTGGQVYLGQNLFSKDVPPLDFSETDLGYMGSQHTFLLKIPEGQISIDAKRGQIFLISGDGLQDLSRLGSGLHHFFNDHLPFEILRYFKDVNIDNHFKGIGLHGVYDSRYDRVIITKLDYIPVNSDIQFDSINQEFYIDTDLGRQILDLQDSEYFCNRSWTLSYNLNTKSWISFHSYLPNFYIAENNFFYSGLNIGCEFDAIAAEIISPTTTTTTTSAPFDCELDAEFTILDCTLEGTAQLVTECTLEGDAYFQFDITTTTTTSTSSTTTTTTTLP